VWECPTTYDLHNALVGLYNISAILGKGTNGLVLSLGGEA